MPIKIKGDGNVDKTRNVDDAMVVEMMLVVVDVEVESSYNYRETGRPPL